MDGKFFTFQERQRKAPGKTIELQCTRCDEHEVRLLVNLYTGHMFDMACTYLCTICKGDMKIVST